MSQEQYEYEVLREIYPLPRMTAQDVLDFNERARIKCQEVSVVLENTQQCLEHQKDG
jgi:hypothetical protein